jgi:hypothetical protein
MPHHLSPEAWDNYLRLVLGAWLMSQATNSYENATQLFIKESKDQHQTEFAESDTSKIVHSLKLNAVLSLGMSCFGFPFERYAKTVTAKGEIGEIFGLHEFSNRATFEKHFFHNQSTLAAQNTAKAKPMKMCREFSSPVVSLCTNVELKFTRAQGNDLVGGVTIAS